MDQKLALLIAEEGAHAEGYEKGYLEGQVQALREFADTRGVNVGDEDSEWWQGYRQAQRECLRDAVDRAERVGGDDRG